MAFTLPIFSDTAINVGESITVNGRSAKSNGGSFVAKEGAAVFQKFVDEYGDYQMHATLDPTAPFAINMIADTALTAMDLFPEYYKDLEFNYTAMWAYINRISFFKSTTDILNRRKEIRKFHPICVPMFIFFTIVHKILALRVKMRDLLFENTFDHPIEIVSKDLKGTMITLSEEGRPVVTSTPELHSVASFVRADPIRERALFDFLQDYRIHQFTRLADWASL